MSRFCRVLLLFPATITLLSGQSKPPEWASISGVVQDAATGRPIPNAVVMLSTTGADPEDAVARTGNDGAFGFAYVPPGKYLLHGDHDRYQHAWFGSESGDRPPTPIELHPGEVRAGAVLRLNAVGSISGAVMDPFGRPIEHAMVVLMRRVYERGKPAWHEAQRAGSDELGRYHLAPVFAGKYVLQATAQNVQMPAGARSEAGYGDAASSPPVFGAQLYPRGTLESISPIEFAPGQHLDGVDFQLPTETPVDVKIRVNLPEGAPSYASVQMTRHGAMPWQSGFGAPATGDAVPLQLPAGRYTAIVMAQSGSRSWRSVQEVDVTAPATELTLTLSPGIDLAGRVDFEGDPSQKPRFRVSLISGDRLPVPNSLTAAVDDAGKFVFHDVPAGIWDINVMPVPRGGYIKSMLLGEYDVLTNEMTIASDTAAPLNIVVSARGGTVTGTVAADPVSHAQRAVVLLAPDGKYARVLSFYGVTASDEEGKFQFRSVTPGRYKLYAFDRMEPGAWQEPDFLKPYEQQNAAAFTVAESETVTHKEVVVQHLKESR